MGLPRSLRHSALLYCSGLASSTALVLLPPPLGYFYPSPSPLAPLKYVTTWLFSGKRVTFPDAGDASPGNIPLLMWLHV